MMAPSPSAQTNARHAQHADPHLTWQLIAHRTIDELRAHEIDSARLCTPEQSVRAEQLLDQITQEVEVEYGGLQMLASPADHKLPGMIYDITFPQLFRMEYSVSKAPQQYFHEQGF